MKQILIIFFMLLFFKANAQEIGQWIQINKKCRIFWIDKLKSDETVKWRGGKTNGYANGKGTFSVYRLNPVTKLKEEQIIYKGEVKEGKFSGKGILLKLTNKKSYSSFNAKFIDYYIGEQYIYEVYDGTFFDGYIVNGKYELDQTYSHGDKYSGPLKYTGEFKMNKFHGKGSLENRNGKIINCIFENDVLNGMSEFEDAKKIDTKEAYQDFINKFPNTCFVGEAVERRDYLMNSTYSIISKKEIGSYALNKTDNTVIDINNLDWKRDFILEIEFDYPTILSSGVCNINFGPSNISLSVNNSSCCSKSFNISNYYSEKYNRYTLEIKSIIYEKIFDKLKITINNKYSYTVAYETVIDIDYINNYKSISLNSSFFDDRININLNYLKIKRSLLEEYYEKYVVLKYEKALSTNTVSSYTQFVESFPKSNLVSSVNKKIIELQIGQANNLEKSYFEKTLTGSIADCETYINKYPNGIFINKVNNQKQKLINDAQRKKAEEERIEEEKRKEQIETENKRQDRIRSAELGEILCYTVGFRSTSSFFGVITSETRYSMILKCFIERKEGKRFQIRIGDISSTDNNYYSYPKINGIEVKKGDIIWINPFDDNYWIKCN